MPISMEVPVITSSQLVSLCPPSSKRVFYRCFFRGLKFTDRLNHRINSTLSLRVWASSDKDEFTNGDYKPYEDESKLVEVIAIGSRKDAVIDFCLDSPFQLSSSLRFWNVHTKDSVNVQLQERFVGKDLNPRIVEASEFLQSCPKAVILVASAGYALDHVAAIDILKTIRLIHGFAVAIFLKPFSFEGQRRQDEVKDLAGKLQEHINFCIDIDIDTLLKKDLVTLDEALKTANNAVLMAINAISVLVSEMHWKIIDFLHHNAKKLKVAEAINVLEGYKEAKIGFGAGNSVKSSILRALYDCPFTGAALEDLNGIIICIIASSDLIDNRDVHASLHTLRQTIEYKGEIIISAVQEPNVEPNMLVTTFVILGCAERQASQKSSILSTLAHHFPFVFKLLGRDSEQLNDSQQNNELEDVSLSKVINSEFDAMESSTVEGMAEGIEKHPEEFETLSTNDYNNIYGSGRSEESEIGILEDRTNLSNFYGENFMEGTLAFQREPLISWNVVPGYQIAQEWAKERAGATQMLDNLSVFHLPVGVRSTIELKDGLNISYATGFPETNTEEDVKEQKVVNTSTSSWAGLTEAGFVAARDIYNNASAVIKGRNADVSKKQGVLSVRAASMLEAERDSPRKWSPIMEMQYRGGMYKGRCQGGLPEGKGRLVLEDGSIYDGMWRFGKRSGPGAFYFSNGDVFQGSWRDDVMHGKGWLYFHSGDRWFANFWKGKANGESRFYSKSGDVFFGHFQDGWRHGQFICIAVDGARCVDIWNEGVLVSREQLDNASDAG